MSYLPNITANIKSADSSSIDGFARLRVSNPFTIFDSKQLYDKGTLYWDEVLNGTATSAWQSGNAEILMSTSASGDYAIRQTKMRFNYQPGKSQYILLSLRMASQTNITKRVGVFHGGIAAPYNTPEGIYLQNAGGTVTLNISNPNGTSASQSVAQASWNVDTFDGTGPSGITLDWNDTQILIIDYEWLGVGRVRIGFVIDGIPFYAHHFNNANNGLSKVYISTPNFPVRYEIRQTGTGSGSLQHLCSSVMSEGGVNPNGPIRSINTAAAVAIGNGNNEPIIGFRLKTTHLDASVMLDSVAIFSAGGNDNLRWYLTYNPTLTGTATSTDVDNSPIQKLVNNNQTVSNEGTTIYESYITTASSFAGASPTTTLRVGSQINGTRDELWLCCEDIGGSAGANVRASLTIRTL